MPIDYSKWGKIEISDDEDETHPNIDTPSLFRWRHQARVERMKESDKEKEDFSQQKNDYEQRRQIIKQKLREAEQKGEDLSKLKIEEDELRKQDEAFKKKEEELKHKERLTPWNVDTLSKDKWAKTIINKEEPKIDVTKLTDEEKADLYDKFIKENRSKVKHYGMLKHYEDSKKYLTENPQLVCEDTANYLVVWCIDLAIEEKHDLMDHVAHQCIVMQFILELAKTMKYDPRACVGPFFAKMQVTDKDYKNGFNEELDAFKERIRRRAKEKIEAAIKEAEEEEKQKRLGPGGLDPMEVFETLPQELQACFESQNIDLLQETLLKMSRTDAELYMERCVKSGLWVPDAKNKETNTAEEIYEKVDNVEEQIPVEKKVPAPEPVKKSVCDDVD